MKVTWVKREELVPTVIKQLKDADVVLDIGCGIMPQPYITPKVHICCEPFGQYVEVLRERLKGELDRTYVVLNATWADAVRIFPQKSVDTVFLVDIVEHLQKEEGLQLLKFTEGIAREQIVLFTPLGFMPQVHENHKDAWNLDGGDWQEHKSGWLPEDFDDHWKILACRDFHTTDNMGNPLKEPFGAFWAIWEVPEQSKDEGQRFQEAPKSLWQNFQTLVQEHQTLVQEHQTLQQEHQQIFESYIKKGNYQNPFID
jgi:hypothetical protein